MTLLLSKGDDEIQQGPDTNIQAYIEELEIHIIAYPLPPRKTKQL